MFKVNCGHPSPSWHDLRSQASRWAGAWHLWLVPCGSTIIVQPLLIWKSWKLRLWAPDSNSNVNLEVTLFSRLSIIPVFSGRRDSQIGDPLSQTPGSTGQGHTGGSPFYAHLRWRFEEERAPLRRLCAVSTQGEQHWMQGEGGWSPLVLNGDYFNWKITESCSLRQSGLL